MKYTGLTVVIPTRNRASLAMCAIRSVLEQSAERLQILVSDNSTINSEAQALSQFCRNLTDKRVHYIVPKEQMPMTQHWDWAVSRAFEISESSHVTFLTDRMLFKKEQLTEAIEIVRQYPDKILCYNIDTVVDNESPVRVIQAPWTGNVFEVNSDQLLFLVSRATLHNCLPRMLNSVVPHASLEKIRVQFGNVFDSISPDFSFCFRVLDTFDSILFFDKTILLQHGLYRSNGESGALGRKTDDFLDFIAELGGKPMNFAAPIPEIMTVFNAICHEYCVLKEQAKSKTFQDIDKRAYLNFLANEIRRIEDPSVRREFEALLVAHGWRDTKDESDDLRSFLRKLVSLPTVVNRIRWLAGVSYTKRAWLILAELFDVHPPDENRFGFRTTAEAIEYADRFPRQKDTHRDLREPLSSARKVARVPSSHQEIDHDGPCYQ